MKRNLLYLMLILSLTFVSCEKEKEEILQTVTSNLDAKLPESESEWVGEKKGEKNQGGYYVNTFTDGFYTFSNYFHSEWGSWGGFAYTNKSDATTPGFKNNSAITGKGKTGKVYLTANTNGFTPAVVSFKDGRAHKFEGMYVTNSTYAYLSMKDGDSFAKKFAAGDWFKLEIYGKNLQDKDTKAVEVYLADFRNGKTEIVNQWMWVELSALGEVKSLHFKLSSSDVGEYGMNTPSYFCADGVKAIK